MATISGSLILTASNHEQRLGQIELKSGSYDGRFNDLATISGSLIQTASLNTVSIQNLNSYSSSLKTAFEFTGSNVVVLGDFTVRGTTTSINSTAIVLGDNVIELNGTSVANGGLLVKDPTGISTISGSLLWDSTNDYWKGGTLGNETKILLAGGDNVFTSSLQLTNINQITSSLIETASSHESRINQLTSFSGSYATTGSNVFVGNQIVSGSIIPATTNVYDLGSSTKSFRHIYVSTGSVIFLDSTGSVIDSISAVSGGLEMANLKVSGVYFGGGVSNKNITIGDSALLANTNGIDNIGIGYWNTSNRNFGNQNVSIGSYGLYQNTGGESNTTLGHSTLQGLITGSYNTALGHSAGYALTSGSFNTIIGYYSFINSGSANTIVGAQVQILTGSTERNIILADGNGNIRARYDNSWSLSGAVSASSFIGTINSTNGVISGSSQIIISNTSGYDTFSSSIDVLNTSQSQSISSLISSASSFESRFGTIGNVTASFDGRFTTLEAVTASIYQFTSSLNTYTGATEIRLDDLEYTASISIGAGLAAEFTKLNQFTASANTRLTALETYSASYAQYFTYSGSQFHIDFNV